MKTGADAYKDVQAFPLSVAISAAGDEHVAYPGMGLRDYFAAHAPQPPKDWRPGDTTIDAYIAWRWYYANLMMAKR